MKRNVFPIVMNYMNQYKINSLNAMHQNHFSNQTNQSGLSRFHHSTTSTIVDRIVFPQMVNDVR